MNKQVYEELLKMVTENKYNIEILKENKSNNLYLCLTHGCNSCYFRNQRNTAIKGLILSLDGRHSTASLCAFKIKEVYIEEFTAVRNYVILRGL